MQQINTIAESLSASLKTELMEDILPYWSENMIDPAGGFYGHISGMGVPNQAAPKGVVLNSRILWTFSSAYRLTRCEKWREVANRAFVEIIDKFEDKEYGGVYWSLDSSGTPLQTKKQIYAVAFAIYGLSEYYRAFGVSSALDAAIRLFESVEEYSFDKLGNGYFEAFARDWSPVDDLRLSDKDANESKTMNTHLHILEAYTSLYRVWKSPRLYVQLKNLIFIFSEHIINSDGHLGLFFNDEWISKSNTVSYGHEIEASWLLWETALVLDDDLVKAIVKPLVWKLADAASEGWTAGGGMVYEKNRDNGIVDQDRHWWVQAEAVVGYFNLWDSFGLQSALEKSVDSWNYIAEHLLDRENGEWYWSVKADGTANLDDAKAGFWKCPYHNGRMCMEVIERLNKYNAI